MAIKPVAIAIMKKKFEEALCQINQEDHVSCEAETNEP